MLQELYPNAYRRYLALPLLGAVLDDFDSWLLAQGYRWNTRQPYIHQTTRIDNYLRKRGRHNLSELTPEDLHRCWIWYHPRNAHTAGAVRVLQRFLEHMGLLPKPVAAPRTRSDQYLDSYRAYLEDIRGFAPKSIQAHLSTVSQFLEHLMREQAPLQLADLAVNDIEDFVITHGKKQGRATVQHIIAHLRGFLRFLAVEGEAPPGLDAQIDTPRVYRQEQLPRALPWETVWAFLSSIDREAPRGLRDYTMFFLMATYGLRNCDITDLTLNDIHWSAGEIRLVQRKTGHPLVLPLTDAVGSVLLHYLRNGRAHSAYRQLFLRAVAPIGPLGRTAVTDAFRAQVKRSGLTIPFRGSHCLRHSYAIHLLRQGTSIKTIGDLLGHRTAESTSVYLRLAIDDLREVGLPVPRDEHLGRNQEVQP